ncbi:MAG: hypothetical protein LBK76_07015, partial [Verrucomicrobiales bacterium]|nr:hypothetical protein [Verrucomicrobiales bacterium]
MKTITWRKLMTVSGFLCLPLADASAAGQNWSITPSGTNEAGLYLLASGTNWESGNAPVGSGDRMRFANTSSGTNLYNNFDAGTRFSFLFEYAANHAYTFSGNSIELAGFTNSNGAGITQTFNLNMSIKDSVSVAGNGNFALTGTLTMNAASVILPTLTGTMSVGNLDLSTFQLRLGAALEKGANWTTYSNALSTVVIGNIVSGAGATFENHSLGQVILTGSNNLTGRITLGNQSFTEFRYTGTADRKLADGGGLYMYNGTLLLTGGTVTEQAGALTLGRSAGFGAGDTRIVRDSGSSSIMISTLSRTTYYTLNVSDNNLLGANTNVFGNTYHTAGFSGPVIANTWITVNARDWAVYDTETKYLRALTTEEYTPFATDLSNRDAYVLLNGSGTVSVADMQINTLKIDTTAGSGTLTADDRRITLYGGGLLLTGGNDYTISGGAIWGVFDTAPRYMLNIWNDSAGTLDLAADLTNIAHLVKSGSGTLILSGSNQFVTQDNQHVFTINSGTVILNHDYALNDGELNLNIGTGGLDLNGHSATVKSIDGQNNGQFTVTNSAEEIADLIVGDRDNKATGAIGLASAVITGNLRLVLQGDSNDNLTFINDNTNTGGMKIIGNTATRVGYLHYRFNKVSTFGTVDAPLELGDNGGFAVRDNWTNWTNPVIISGSNAFIVSEYANTLASNGVWSGAGDVELRNLALTLAAPLDEFSGTIKFSAAAANSTSKVTRVTSPIVQDSALATGSAATYALWRAADGGNDESTLNVTLQFKGAGTAYDVHIGDLVSFSQLTGSAAMKSGDNENSRGLVANNTANSTANLIVGSANHAYSEFAERIADSGTLDVNGAVTGVQS